MSAERILVVGPSGAGKSRFSVELGRRLGLPVLHLDAHFWGPGYEPAARDAWRERVLALCRRPRWVMDGTYESTFAERLPRAELVVYLEAPRLTCLARALKRMSLARAASPDFPLGHRVDLGLLRYIWRFDRSSRPVIEAAIEAQDRGGDMVRLSGGRAAEAFLETLASKAR